MEQAFLVTLWETYHEESFIGNSIINYERFSPKILRIPRLLDPTAVNLKPGFTCNTEEHRHEITTKLMQIRPYEGMRPDQAPIKPSEKPDKALKDTL